MTVRSAVALAGLCLATGVAGAQDLQIVLRGGDSVPGAAGTVDFLLKLDMNNTGQIVLRGSTTATLDDFVAAATHTPFAITRTLAEGDLVVGDPSLTYQRTLTQLVDINNAGQFVFADGGATAGPATAYRDGAIVARQGGLIGTEVINDIDQVQRVVAAVAPKPVNLLVNAPFITVREAAELGVRRISVGGTLARTAWGGFLDAAREIADAGTFTRFEGLPNVDAMLGD